jgi:PleD family two-component response regulator
MVKRVAATVLVLADGPAAAVYRDALREAGLDVIEAGTSESAFDTAQRVQPHVIVASFDSEIREDRLTLCRRLRDALNTRRIPIVLTADELRDGDTDVATNPGALVLRMVHRDVDKLVAAVKGVLAVPRPRPLRASIRQTRKSKAR